MTKVIFYRADGIYYGFEEKGHTGFAESGNDILCAALSAMTMLIINTVEISYATNVEYTIDEETTDIRVMVHSILPENSGTDSEKRYAVSGLIEGYYYQLNDMLEDYYDYLDVEVSDEYK
ncbi:MAG: ribosomal-processing cysteine protease Prp [Clostridia bacterium]|nr:ribosomal-processing cysteine protease Prp [Clostridia bacterium]